MDLEDNAAESAEQTRDPYNIPATSIEPSHDKDRHPRYEAPTLKGAGIRREFDKSLSFVKPNNVVPKPAKFRHLPYATSQTGLIYDVRMRFHVEAKPSDDDLHPEDPRRIHAIYEAFVSAGLAWREGDSGPIGDYYMGRIETRMVTRDEVLLVHTLDHWNWVQSLSTKTADELDVERQHPPEGNDSIYLSSSTPYCAALSAGGAIEACRAILLGKVKNVFAVIRPPGHHAEREDAKGFCFYDNVSIATKACQREFGEKCRKVFILDWDVHHGNGIQQANYDDPNVLYISLHVHRNGIFYPELSYRDKRVAYGDHLHCGKYRGLGKNVNIPWSRQGMGDADYIYAFQQVVMPIAQEFDPDLVIIAAGFDAAEGDMLGGCNVTPAGYAHMTHMLMTLAQGKVAVCLEGGYNLESIARSSCAVGRTLMGEPPDRLENAVPTDSAVDDVKLVLRQQSKFWASLYPKDMSERLAGPLHGVRMHNVVRTWQAETMYNEYGMTPLFIQKQHLAKEFENQVLATPNYKEQCPLLVILHDPPEVLASPDPRTGKLELHNTWLADIVKTYVDWAVKQGFAVIDVNLPKYVADIEPGSQGYEATLDPNYRRKEAEKLLTYLWENYIEMEDHSHIFLMGTNIGHGAITDFIKSHEDRAQEMITKAISFVEDVGVRSCKSTTNDYLPVWYYHNSMVFISHDHNFWGNDVSKKPSKRFGKHTRSQAVSLTDMLVEHQKSICVMLQEETEGWSPKQKTSGDEMEVDTEVPTTSPKGMPPIGNFALSPSRNLVVGGPTTLVPPSRGNGSAGSGSKSPPRMPSSGGFALSPRR